MASRRCHTLLPVTCDLRWYKELGFGDERARDGEITQVGTGSLEETGRRIQVNSRRWRSRGRQANECRWPREAETGKETNLLLKPPEAMWPR